MFVWCCTFISSEFPVLCECSSVVMPFGFQASFLQFFLLAYKPWMTSQIQGNASECEAECLKCSIVWNKMEA